MKPGTLLSRFKGDLCHNIPSSSHLIGFRQNQCQMLKKQKENRNECLSEDKITMKLQQKKKSFKLDRRMHS